MMDRAAAGTVAALAVGALTAGVLASAPAFAYVRTTTEQNQPMVWSSPCLFLTVLVDDPPANLTGNQFLTAARAAAGTWSRGTVACTGLSLTLDPTTQAEASVAYDRKNRVMFRRTSWCKEPREVTEPCYDAAALAITSVFAKKDDGQILDADIEINAVNFSWADVEVGGPASINAQDVQNTLTHEFGHLIGLDHNCYVPNNRPRPLDHEGKEIPNCSQASAAVREATMFASVIRGDTTRRSLADDDLKAVCDIYPVAKSPTCTKPSDGGLDGGCAVGHGRPVGRLGFEALALLGLALALIRRRVSR